MKSSLFDADAIRALAAILTETGLTEIEIGEKDSRIRVARSPAPIAYAATGMSGDTGAKAAAALTPAPAADISKHPGAIVSPMVGVAYLAPEPGMPPYVSVGQAISAGQTLMLIEAMKTFNQIKAPKAGTVTQIIATTGGPVEYGEVLMIVE